MLEGDSNCEVLRLNGLCSPNDTVNTSKTASFERMHHINTRTDAHEVHFDMGVVTLMSRQHQRTHCRGGEGGCRVERGA